MTDKKEKPADGWPWQISPNRPYFFCDPGGDGFMYYATAEERNKAANEAIQFYLDDCWSEEVANVVAGVLTHQSTQVDRIDRPDDSELDEDDLDGEGTYWGDWTYTCDYKLMPIDGIDE